MEHEILKKKKKKKRKKNKATMIFIFIFIEMRNRTYQFGFINDSVFRNATLRNVKNILCKKYHLLNKYKKFIFFFDGGKTIIIIIKYVVV